ncbi:MAG: ATP-binding protein [Dehalococcoidia bacterium]
MKQLRVRDRLTQAELAAQLGVSVASVIRWEGGQSRPGRRALSRLEQREGSSPEQNHSKPDGDTATGAAPVPLPADPGLSGQITRLPADTSSFIGRRRELDELSPLIEGDRLVTLIGPGGCGKTRLAIEAARRAEPSRSAGVALIALAAVTEPDQAPRAVAAGLGVGDLPGLSIDAALAQQLRESDLLLLLDNCEQVVESCAALANVLLRACPRLTILATSRIPLALAGERLFRVPPLSLPRRDVPSFAAALKPAELLAFDAIRLFVDRAQALGTGLDITPDTAGPIVEICTRLDGLPLAIEMAAARASLLAPAEILARLDDRFRLLGEGYRSADARHQTLLATVRWSVELLPHAEQTLFLRLAVFAGSFALAAVEAVCSGVDVPRPDALNLLGHLVDASLVQREPAPGGSRYRLLETLRIYARAELQATGEATGVLTQHAGYGLALVAHVSCLALWYGLRGRHVPGAAPCQLRRSRLRGGFGRCMAGEATRGSRACPPRSPHTRSAGVCASDRRSPTCRITGSRRPPAQTARMPC